MLSHSGLAQSTHNATLTRRRDSAVFDRNRILKSVAPGMRTRSTMVRHFTLHMLHQHAYVSHRSTLYRANAGAKRENIHEYQRHAASAPGKPLSPAAGARHRSARSAGVARQSTFSHEHSPKRIPGLHHGFQTNMEAQRGCADPTILPESNRSLPVPSTSGMTLCAGNSPPPRSTLA